MRMPYAKKLKTAAVTAALFAMSSQMGRTQVPGVFPDDRPPVPGPLSTIPIPLPTNLSEFVADIQTAKILGKAFFWDQQAGSDGLACASCHFQAGADNRVKNALDPGLRNENPAQQNLFHVTASNRGLKVGPPPGGGPNYTLKKADYPFHQLANTT